MNNKKRLEFIKQNYFNNRAISLLPKEEQEEVLLTYAAGLLEIVPKKLYKYRACNDNNLNIIREKKAWFSNPSSWNDPLDVTILYDLEKDIKYLNDNVVDISIKITYSIVKQYINSSFKEDDCISSEAINDAVRYSFDKYGRFSPLKMINYLKPIIGYNYAKDITTKTQQALDDLKQSKFLDDFKKQLNNLLSFNKIRDNVLMYSLSESYINNHQWAMYADEGKGFCIEYEILPKNNEELKLISNLLPIYYGKKKPILFSELLEKSIEIAITKEKLNDYTNNNIELLFKSLFTKDKQWSGEEEWRFSLSIDQCDSNKVNFDFAKSIYLGENIEDNWKHQLIEIAKEQKLNVYQRELDYTKSKWIYSRIIIN